MATHAPSVVVFDFDGTLVISNQLKYDAYFALFPADAGHRRTIRDVLSRQYEESRFVILDSIVAATWPSASRPETRRELVARLAGEYGRIVTEGAKTCPERPGAGALLRELSDWMPLYLASTTPMEPLVEILSFRGWLHLFRKVYGHPHRKEEVLGGIVATENVSPCDIIMIGDGESDRIAASRAGCLFMKVEDGTTVAKMREAVLPGDRTASCACVPPR